eukprot:TRINITY_DN3054_c0_g1_i3.p1 TRINITY_DN3054_c0_g1~~TRINITY_DN3054_c0_g1_i3.p1  ORF type:complete len:368 (-),score=41.26 TRINITY_DN3054_c0_g1_i3:61-1164(-)
MLTPATRTGQVSIAPWKGRIDSPAWESWKNVIVVDHAEKIGICSSDETELQLVDFASGKTRSISEIVPLLPGSLRDARFQLWRNKFLCCHGQDCVVIDLRTSSVIWSTSFPTKDVDYCIFGDRILISIGDLEGPVAHLYEISTKRMLKLHNSEAPMGYIQLALDSYKAIILKMDRRYSGVMIFDVRDGTPMHQINLERSGWGLIETDISDRLILRRPNAIMLLDFSDRWHNHAASIDCITFDGTPTIETWPAPSVFEKIRQFFQHNALICVCVKEIADESDSRTRIYCFSSDDSTSAQDMPITQHSFPGASLPIAFPPQGRSVYVKQVISHDQCYLVNIEMQEWETIKSAQIEAVNSKFAPKGRRKR